MPREENDGDRSSAFLKSLKGLDDNRSDNLIGVQDQENTEESGFKGLDSTDPENFSNLQLTVSDIGEDSFSADIEPSSTESTEQVQPSQPEFEPNMSEGHKGN